MQGRNQVDHSKVVSRLGIEPRTRRLRDREGSVWFSAGVVNAGVAGAYIPDSTVVNAEKLAKPLFQTSPADLPFTRLPTQAYGFGFEPPQPQEYPRKTNVISDLSGVRRQRPRRPATICIWKL